MSYRKVLGGTSRPQKLLKPEALVHLQICQYLQIKYPQAIFRTDYAAGLKLSITQATMNRRLQSSRAYPDLFIAEPRGGYAGLFIELKAEKTVLYKKDGTLRKDEHVEEQAEMLEQLKRRGYAALFCVGYDHAQRAIDRYMALKVNVPTSDSAAISSGLGSR